MPKEIRHADRRSCPRSRETHLLTVTPSGPQALGSPVHTGLTLDVSDLGAHIETPEPLVLGQELTLEIALGDHIRVTKGKPIHTELLPNGLYRAGIEFTARGLNS